jgi:adenylate kinase
MKTPALGMADRAAAILLLGPTGSGKTPVGDRLEDQGLRGRRLLHFDFGANLRRIAALSSSVASGYTAAELGIIRNSLATGALLEDEHFPLAWKVLERFLARRRFKPGDAVILNGFPRHAGQAKLLDPLVDVRLVVVLRATLPVLQDRIRVDPDGDRAGRIDDSPAEIGRKLALFEHRTLPLVKFYTARGVKVVTLRVTGSSRAAGLAEALNKRLRRPLAVF